MLVKWTEERIKGIPKADNMGMVILVPGYMEVEDSNWAKARERVMKDIESGRIVEEWMKIVPEQKADFALVYMDDKKQWFAPAKLSNINRPRVAEVVKETYHVPTLLGWMDEELRQDVRLHIMKQLVEVDKANAEQHKMTLAASMDRIG